MNKKKRYYHGLIKHPLYTTWCQMRQRCSNKNNPRYESYGGRGITICSRWDNFALFIRDMGEKPSPEHTLDRRDNNQGYYPHNCRWATPSQQSYNCRKSKKWSSKYWGVTRCKKGKCWRAFIHNKKCIHLGNYRDEIDAAKAYNEAAITLNSLLSLSVVLSLAT